MIFPVKLFWVFTIYLKELAKRSIVFVFCLHFGDLANLQA